MHLRLIRHATLVVESGGTRLLVDPQLCFDCGDPDSLPEGGMGLALIRQLFDAIAYETRDGRNRMTLTRWLVVI